MAALSASLAAALSTADRIQTTRCTGAASATAAAIGGEPMRCWSVLISECSESTRLSQNCRSETRIRPMGRQVVENWSRARLRANLANPSGAVRNREATGTQDQHVRVPNAQGHTVQRVRDAKRVAPGEKESRHGRRRRCVPRSADDELNEVKKAGGGATASRSVVRIQSTAPFHNG